MAVAAGLAIGSVGAARVAAAEPALAAWTGGVSLYREGTFTTQRSWLWCTAAGVQIVRNIVDHERDHTTRGQRTYFEWMRERNRYDLPESAGVDPAGWTAGLRHFVDDRYRLVSSPTFDAALRSAVTRLRQTNLPVALTVSHGGHGWILTGFRATADPAATTTFTVTSVRVVGPLYGRQSKNGYDMPPNTKLTPTQLKRFFTPWKYDPKPMVWDGRYVSIQPVPAKPRAAVAPTPEASPASPALATATPTASPAPASRSPSPSLLAAVVPSTRPTPVEAPPTSDVVDRVDEGAPLALVLMLAALAAVVGIGAVARTARARRGTDRA